MEPAIPCRSLSPGPASPASQPRSPSRRAVSRCRSSNGRRNFATSAPALQLSPNATRILDRLGVLAGLEPFAVRPPAIVLRNATSSARTRPRPAGRIGRAALGRALSGRPPRRPAKGSAGALSPEAKRSRSSPMRPWRISSLPRRAAWSSRSGPTGWKGVTKLGCSSAPMASGRRCAAPFRQARQAASSSSSRGDGP